MPPHPLTNFEIHKYDQNELRFNEVYSRDIYFGVYCRDIYSRVYSGVYIR